MRRRHALSAALALAMGGLGACDAAPSPRAPATPAASDGPWLVFDDRDGTSERYHPHRNEGKLTLLRTPRELRPSYAFRRPDGALRFWLWAATPDTGGIAVFTERDGTTRASVVTPKWRFNPPVTRIGDHDVAAMRARLAQVPLRPDHAHPIEFGAEPDVEWRDVAARWTTLAASGPPTRDLRLVGTSDGPEDGLRRRVSPSNHATRLVVFFPTPRAATGRRIDVVTDDAVAGPFPPVTIRSGGAEYRFPGGDPYRTTDNVEAANRAWRAFSAALREAAAGGARSADLSIGPRVPWAHVAQLLLTFMQVGVTSLHVPEAPFGLELRFASRSGADPDELVNWEFSRASAGAWTATGLALAGLLGIAAWAPWERLRRRGRVSDRAMR